MEDICLVHGSQDRGMGDINVGGLSAGDAANGVENEDVVAISKKCIDESAESVVAVAIKSV